MKRKLQLHANDHVNGLAASGRYHDTSCKTCETLGVSVGAVKLTLNRLARHELIVSSTRQFCVIVPLETSVVDFIHYQDRPGGPDQAAIVLSELAECVGPEKIVAASGTGPVRVSGQQAMNR